MIRLKMKSSIMMLIDKLQKYNILPSNQKTIIIIIMIKTNKQKKNKLNFPLGKSFWKTNQNNWQSRRKTNKSNSKSRTNSNNQKYIYNDEDSTLTW